MLVLTFDFFFSSPIIFRVDNLPLYQGRFVLATLMAPSSASQATTTNTAVKVTAPPHQQRANSRGTTENNHTIAHHDVSASQHDVSVNCHDESLHASPSGAAKRQESVASLPEILRHQASSSSIVTPGRTGLLSSKLNGTESFSNPVRRVNNRSTSLSTSMSNRILPPFPRNNCSQVDENGDPENVDVVDETIGPPSKRQRRGGFLFQQVFESTFDPNNMPGADVVLARGSDNEED